MIKDTVYFVSDAHFGIPLPGCELQKPLFFDFLEGVSLDASDLFIVGDLFDFWIEYRYAIRPDYFSILHALKKVSERGVRIHYLAGNHDFALGPFLEQEIGISIHCNDYDALIQGKKVYIFHGDGLLRRDVGYRILRKILRSRVNQFLFKLLHPDLGVLIGAFCSGTSRKYLRVHLSDEIIEEYRDHALKSLKKGNDLVIFGHTHRGDLCHYESGVYLNTGSWLINYNYATMRNGEVSLWRYREGLSPELISAIDLKKGRKES